MRRLVLLVMLGACIQPKVLVCGDKICPVDTVCVPALDECHTAAQLAACSHVDDGVTCRFGATDGTCRKGVCFAPECGDGFVEFPEECDGDNLAGMTCLGLGYYTDSPLGCTSKCQLDTTACAGFCGDTVRNGPELCDGTDLGGKTCKDYGFYDAAGLGCLSVCLHDTSKCTGYCGDHVRNGPELCDGASPNADCLGFGYDLGAIKCGSNCAADLATCRRVDWKAESVPANPNLLAVWQAPTGETFAIGGNTIVDDGTGWRPMVPTSTTLRAVAGRAANDVYAVGDGGLVVHYDGNPQLQWTPIDAGLAVDLKSLFIRGNEIFVVGHNGASSHFDGTTWTAMTGAFYTLYGVWGTAGKVYAVGDFGVFVYDGTVPETWAYAGGPSIILGITGWTDSDFFVWTATNVFHWNGASYVSLGMPPGGFDAMVAAYSPGPNELIAAAEYNFFQSELFHHDGTSWASLTIDDPFTTPRFIRGIHGRRADDLIAVGISERAFRYQGLAWDGHAKSTTIKPVAVCGARRDAVVTANGTALTRWNGTTWGSVGPASGAVADLWCGGTDVFSVGAGGTVMHSINSGASFTAEASGTASNLSAVYGSSATNVYAGGVGGAFTHYNGSWTPLTSAPQAITDLWVSPSGTVFALLGGGVYRYNGAWSAVSGSPGGLTAIWGTADDNFVVVGSSGVVYRFTGATFVVETQLPVLQITAIAGASASKIYVASNELVFMYDGADWSEVRSPTFSGIADLWATDNLLALGGLGGTYLMVKTGP